MTDLDDFFAKKDKKKSKTKTKFLTTDELVKNLEDTSKKDTAVAKSKKLEPITSDSSAISSVIGTTSAPTAAATNTPNVDEKEQPITLDQVAAEEEWKEFEEEQRKDYTGLKIGQLTLNEDEDYTPTDGDDEEGDSESNTNNPLVRPSNLGPWKKVIPAEEVTQIQMESTPNQRQLYVSPALRQSQTLGARAPPKTRKTAPDITNADYFPSLGAARPEEQRKKKNEPAFEEVRHGGRVQRVQEPTITRSPAASNRFQSLDEEDS